MTCPKCQGELSEGAEVCPHCGGASEGIEPSVSSLLTQDDEAFSLGALPTQRQVLAGRRFRVGEIISDRYRVTGELGQGGMGMVYKCFDEVGGIEVALKALPPELSHDTGEMEEVRENFRIVQALHHPNITAVKTLERDPASGDYYLILECAEGVDLRRWRKQKGGHASLEEVLPILSQVAAALDYAHWQKIIHRDIKPSNVIVGSAGLVKVLDFGLAAQIQSSLSRRTKADHRTSGTGPYMAPEQWRGQYQDGATDQYALGVMAYELLNGRLPFESAEVRVLKHAILEETAQRPAGTGPAAWRVIEQALAKDRQRRHRSCGDFISTLERAHTADVEGIPVGPVRIGLRRGGMIVAGVVLAVAITGTIVWTSWLSPRFKQISELKHAANELVKVTRRLESELPLPDPDLQAVSSTLANFEDLLLTNPACKQDRNFSNNLAIAASQFALAAEGMKAKGLLVKLHDIAEEGDFGSERRVVTNLWKEASQAFSGMIWTQAYEHTTNFTAQAGSLWSNWQAAGKQAASAQQKACLAMTNTQGAEAQALAKAEWKLGEENWKIGVTNREAQLYANAVVAFSNAGFQFEQALSNANATSTTLPARNLRSIADAATPPAAPAGASLVDSTARNAALTAQGRAETARADAKKADAENLATARWTKAVSLFNSATNHLATDSFASAESDFHEAAKAFRDADAAAAQERRLRDSITEFGRARTNFTDKGVSVFGPEYKEFIRCFGGQHWAELTTQVSRAENEATEGKYSDAALSYSNALSHLEAYLNDPSKLRFTNRLGMTFVYVGPAKVFFGVYETRVRDYRTFLKEPAYRDYGWDSPDGLSLTDDQPVVNVRFSHATDFCKWLNDKQPGSRLLRYRLPADWEWSAAVGLMSEKGATPEARSQLNATEAGDWLFPWGWRTSKSSSVSVSPPANIAVYENDNLVNLDKKTACSCPKPVSELGAVEPYGLVGMAGNANEWCLDFYNTDKSKKVLRGGSFRTQKTSVGLLLSGNRFAWDVDSRDPNPEAGFRVVFGERSPLEE